MTEAATPYSRLAGVYDELVVDPCYSDWADFLDRLWADDPEVVSSVLDVCCGTGLLTAERTALNLACHLSGVATATAAWVDALAGTPQPARQAAATLATLAEALGKHRLQFNDLYVNLVTAGEQAGILDALLDRLATYKEKTQAIISKIKSALFYPISVLVVAFIVTAVIMIFVVPSFKSMFSSFGADLPGPTLAVIVSIAAMSSSTIRSATSAAVAPVARARTYR